MNCCKRSVALVALVELLESSLDDELSLSPGGGGPPAPAGPPGPPEPPLENALSKTPFSSVT